MIEFFWPSELLKIEKIFPLRIMFLEGCILVKSFYVEKNCHKFDDNHIMAICSYQILKSLIRT